MMVCGRDMATKDRAVCGDYLAKRGHINPLPRHVCERARWQGAIGSY